MSKYENLFDVVAAKTILKNWDLIESSFEQKLDVDGVPIRPHAGLCYNVNINVDHPMYKDAIDAWRESENLEPLHLNYNYWIGGSYEYNFTKNLFVNPLRKSALEFLLKLVDE